MATADDIDVDFDSDKDRLELNLEKNFRVIRELLLTVNANSTTGNVNISTLPTSSVGLVAGDLWNNLGVVNII